MSSLALQEAWRAALAPGLDGQIALWTRHVPEALKSGRGEEAAALAYASIPRLATSRKLRRQSSPAIASGLADPAFRKAFAGALLKQEVRHAPPNVCALLLQWTCLVIDSLDVESGSKAITKIIELQGKLLGRIAADASRRRLQSSARLAGASLRARGDVLLALYLGALKETGSGALAAVLCGVGDIKAKPAETTQDAAITILAGDKCLGGREPLAAAEVEAWGLALAGCNAGVISGKLVPAVDRGLKRSPEIALQNLTMLASRLDPASAAGPALAAPLLHQVVTACKHTKGTTRAVALRAVEALASLTSADELLSACSSALALFDGSAEGKIKGVAERVCLAKALGLLVAPAVPAPKEETTREAAKKLLEGVAKAYPGEPGEEARVALLDSAARLLPVAGAAGSAFAARLGEGVEEAKEGPRRAHLLALNAAQRCEAEAAEAGSTALTTATMTAAPALLKLATDGLAKPGLRGDGLLAALCLARLLLTAGADSDKLAKGVKDAGLFASGSALLQPVTAAKVAAPAAAAELAGLLLAAAAPKPVDAPDVLHKTGGDNATALAETLTLLLLHHDRVVRREAATQIQAIGSQHASMLTAALLHWLDHPAEAAQVFAPVGAAEEDPGAQELAARYAHAVHAVAKGAGAASPLGADALAGLAVAAHSEPATWHRAGSAAPDALWRAAVLPALQASRENTLASLHGDDGGAAVLSALITPLLGGAASQPAALLAALRSVVALEPSRLVPRALELLTPALDRTAHDALSPMQLRVAFTRPGRLATESDGGAIMPAEVLQRVLASGPTGGAVPPPSTIQFYLARSSAATTGPEGQGGTSASGKGTSGTLSSAGARAATAAGARAGTGAARATTATSKTGAGGRGAATTTGGRVALDKGKDAAAIARQKQLESEAAVRAEVAAIAHKLSRGLLALAAVSSASKETTASNAEALIAPIMPLLGSSLVGDGAAFVAAAAVCTALPHGLGAHAADVAAALRLSVLAGPSSGLNGSSAEDKGVAGDEPATVSNAYTQLTESRCMQASIAALLTSVGGRAATEEEEAVPADSPLPAPAIRLAFPILRAVLSADEASALHAAALQVLGVHIGSSEATTPLDPAAVLGLLYRTLEVVPALRAAVAPLLARLCGAIESDGPALSAALAGLAARRAGTRAAALAALRLAPALRGGNTDLSPAALCALWTACSDPDIDNASAATVLWELAGATLPRGFVPLLAREYLVSDRDDIRTAAAAALASGLLKHPGAVPESLEAVTTLFSSSEMTSASSADGGEEGSSNDGSSRSIASKLGALQALEASAPHLTAAQLPVALDFLLARGLADADASVRGAVVLAGVGLVNAHGAAHAAEMLPLFEDALAGKSAAGSLGEERADLMRQGVVVLLGTLGRHLPADSPKVRGILAALLDALSTPSEAVQRRASDCMPALAQALSADREFIAGTLKDLLDRCLRAKSYGDRRGAAFGLAGMVKGLGISSLKGYAILDALKTGVEDKASPESREGALMAYECMSEKLGRLFEPYITSLLPALLTSFGDGAAPVREAATAAARAIMGQLSAQGVRLVLPVVLAGVEEKTWRTKEGSIQLLGSMAFLNPRQLGTALPSIVPCLGQALGDPHPRVAGAARAALDDVASVIRNPEVARLVPSLLAALADPHTQTRKTLDILLSTVFVNTVDVASLALLMPVVSRGLRDRSGDCKKRAARIVGNLSSLANDPRDMAPYAAALLPDLRAALVDPLPEVRATSARALGALVRGMGPAAFPDLLPWLLERLRSDAGSVERSGAAQGLAEVLAVQGPAAVEAVLPAVLEGARSRTAAAREGSLTLFKYLPGAMPEAFRAHLALVLPCVLQGLADEAEGVRDASLAAARVAVELYATSALGLLLPAVETGVLNASWRIRQSSIELLGDLLFKVAGTSGRIQQDLHNEHDEGIGAEEHGTAMAEALGSARRGRVLGLLYMARSDEAAGVRAAALHVWKTLVTNTPRTLSEILPALMALVVRSLADPGDDARAAAGRCLGELVRKMGDRVLAQVVPILRDGMSDPDARTRQGVCAGLRDVLENAGREPLAPHLPELLPAVQAALCDEDAAVRAAAGGVFGVLVRGAGGQDGIVPGLLAGLDDTDRRSQALEGLRVVLGVRPGLLGGMLPRLLKAPVSAAKLEATAALCGVAGSALHPHLGTLVPLLTELASDHPDVSPAAAAANSTLSAVVLAVQEDGLHLLAAELLHALDEPVRRRGAAKAVGVLFKSAKLDAAEHAPALIAALVPLLVQDDRNDAEGVQACWEALTAVTGSIPKELQPNYDAVLVARDRERRKKAPGPLLIAGLCLPKALGPLLPIYTQGILQGSAELRELAAEGLGQLIQVTGEDTLRPYVVQATGPLIRIMGDRFPAPVKTAILNTLGTLIAKAGVGLKPFVPQLQTTFVKGLLDPEPRVRLLAAADLGGLARLTPRLDALLGDLATSARAAVPGGAEAYLLALEGAVAAAGERAAADALARVATAAQDALAHAGDDDASRTAAARALGALCAHLPPQEVASMLRAVGTLGTGGAAASGKLGDRLGAAAVAAALARHAPARLTADAEAQRLCAEVTSAVATRFARDPSPDVRLAAARGAGGILSAVLAAAIGDAGDSDAVASRPAVLPQLASVFVGLLGTDQDSDVQRLAMAALRRAAGLGAAAPELLAPHFEDLVPSLLAIIQSTSGSTKLAAERTLSRLLGLSGGDEGLARRFLEESAGAGTKRSLTDAYIRRLAKLPPGDEDDDDAGLGW